MLTLAKYSIGIGDRFAHQAKAQLRACVLAVEQGTVVVPVWNKSNREHTIIGSEPASVRAAADAAVRDLKWPHPHHVDADHIRLETVDRFIVASDFYTIDVADSIGHPAAAADVAAFVDRHPELASRLEIPGIAAPLTPTRADVERIAGKYLKAVQDAGAIYRKIVAAKGAGQFITEVSMDETDAPQTPPELLVILAALADEGVPVQTIAPKFTGRFNKGVDYVGDLAQFEKEFRDDLAVIAFAIGKYGLPANLKLSVHSGSDKFSIYAPIRRALATFGAGLHIKTAGTTWLEEVIGLAEAGGAGLELAKEIYAKALKKKDELCAPYATVIDIDAAKLPSAEAVAGWTAEQFTSALRHDQQNPGFNPHLRQLVHVGFKVAAQMGDRYLKMLEECEPSIARNVTENLYARHLKPLFVGSR
ncbi:tagaturonate epimerase family protein [Fimbriiglobus ruber]|uniref:Tagaturonate/fructuronate epimerase n=1 Tax=Fimbriiglobus ruber TaxID=1908690 RepID=A0A225EDA3_9BACT|nr:tagaturonate epimerase family protein [Fimbriiglobus ruber]OWK46317.1 putative D-tagaturonate epimerase [Fimbriiglobus ruber]